MRRFIGRRMGAIAVVVFLLGTAAMVARVLRRTERVTAHPGYSTVSRIVFYPAGGGSPVLQALRTRYQSAGGAFREITTGLKRDGSASATVLFSVPGTGTFTTTLAGDTFNFLSPASPRASRFSEAAMKRLPEFEREERVVGYRALKLHYDNGPSGWRELWLAPELNGAILQAAFKSKAGILKQEAIQVTSGEPEQFLVSQGLDKPVSFAGFERQISKAESAGRHSAAAKMRQALDSTRKVVPAEAHSSREAADSCGR